MFGLEPVWTGFGIFVIVFAYIAGIGFAYKVWYYDIMEDELLVLCSLFWPISLMAATGLAVGSMVEKGTIQNGLKKIMNKKQSSDDSSDTTESV